MQKIETGKPFWSLSAEESLSALKTTKDGLSEAGVEEKRKEFGPNKLHKEHRFSKFKILGDQFKSPLIFILIIAGIVTLVIHEWIDAIVIFLAIGVNTALGFYQENRAENALDRLRSYIKERARVIREGQEHEVDAEQLVPGDIIHLSYGSRIPADARLISIKNLSVDESILTGESLPVSKQVEEFSEATPLPERKNMAFAGTLVVEGYATAVITSTGSFTEIGRIAEMVAEAERGKTPLQKAIWKLAWVIAVVATFIIAGVFALGIYRGEPMAEMFLVAAAVAVGAIPEALPIALTVILSVGVEQLVKRKGVMRNLAAAETLGSTSVIITDKTGTLTKADLTLTDIVSFEELIQAKNKKNKALKSLNPEQKKILSLAVFNTDVVIENPEEKAKDWQIIGRALENQIVRSAGINGLKPEVSKKEANSYLALSFDSKNKFSVSYVESSKNTPSPIPKSKNFHVILGAPDILLERAEMDKESYIKARNKIETMSQDGKRLVGLAVMPVSGKSTESVSPDSVKNIKFMGVLAFFDPVRPGVPTAIKKMEKSGVKIIMATGDLKGTALAIAKDLGWDVKEGEVLTGEELKQLSDEELLKNIDNIKVYARVTPEDKMRIGLLLKSKGEVVGMTGDGVNDAPSLKAVDIGIAVGSGSDVAKEVADLVLLDDNFETIVAAIEEGRRILNNIRKSFVYLMSNSLDEIILIGGALLLSLPLPLTALQIIWVNFFTGSLPALSYAFDDFIDKDRTTAKSSRKIIDSEVKVLALGIGTLTSLLLLALYWTLLYFNIPELEARTFLFVCFASYILFVAFSFRSLKKPIFTYNIFSNKFLSFSVLIGLFLISITVYVPFLQRVFGTTALSAYWLGWVVVWLIGNLSLVEAVKWLYKNK